MPSVIGAVIAEFMQSDSGLGYLVLVAVGNVNTPLRQKAFAIGLSLESGLTRPKRRGAFL